MESVNDKGSYVCTNDGCEHNFEHNTSLSRHMRTCTSRSRKTNKVDLASFALLENGKYECLKCKQTFKHKNALYKHKTRCKADKPKPRKKEFKCQVCCKVFDRQYHLTRHEKKHNRKEQYHCQRHFGY